MKTKRIFQLAGLLFGLTSLMLLLALVANYYDQGLSISSRNRNIILLPIMLAVSLSMFYMSTKLDKNKTD